MFKIILWPLNEQLLGDPDFFAFCLWPNLIPIATPSHNWSIPATIRAFQLFKVTHKHPAFQARGQPGKEVYLPLTKSSWSFQI